jgi:AAA+ ATPase superfamily predicted ATPase
MIGRETELKKLEELYTSDKFEFLAMYGRRRVGKTTILEAFSEKHKALFFSAQEKNDALNLSDFSKVVQIGLDGQFISPFQSWDDAFTYITKRAGEKHVTLIIDEFPFLALANESIKSILQHKIDHEWSKRNIFLILCGSSVSFMENEVLGYKAPLYGRITASMEVKPFNYLESSLFFPDYSDEDKLIAYGILGGIPRYLNAFDPKKSILDNIKQNILTENAFLYDEPQSLMRTELREPMIYNSIMDAISRGYNRITEISDVIHEDRGKCGKYLATLQTIRLIEKQVPAGEPETSKKTIYNITDNYYKFWYRFVFSNKNYINMLGLDNAADEIMEEINDYMGLIFENIVKEYLVVQAKAKKLPFTPVIMAKWWGNNPMIKQQDDVDLLAIDKSGKKAIFCECKFRNKPMPMEEYDDLVTATKAFNNFKEITLMFVSKAGFTKPVIERAKKEKAILLTTSDLFS